VIRLVNSKYFKAVIKSKFFAILDKLTLLKVFSIINYTENVRFVYLTFSIAKPNHRYFLKSFLYVR